MGRFFRDIDPLTFAQIEQTLLQMGVIKMQIAPGGGDRIYTWIGDT
jgi:hypothetical protein